LRKVGHVKVVRGHRVVDASDAGPGVTETTAQFGLFASGDRGIEPADPVENVSPDHEDPAAMRDFADGSAPFDIAEAIVDGGVG
jgi:hypothetical protein